MLASAKLVFAKEGPELVTACIEALRTFPQPPYGRPAHASGKTERAIREEHGDDFLQLLGPAHVQALITGRKHTSANAEAGNPNLAAILAQWAKDKGIVLADGDYKRFGFALAKKIHREGTALYRLGQPSRIFSHILTPQRLAVLKARIAAGEMVAITTELRNALS